MLKTVGNPASRTGDQTIVAGNLVIGTSGKGIDFSADPSAAGMTSELLDDYEEGTWTPTFATDGVAFTSVTMGVEAATYTKIGNTVFAWCYINAGTAITIGSATGNVNINGLPFTPGSTGVRGGGTIINEFAWATSPLNAVKAVVNPASTSVLLYKLDMTRVVVADVAATGNAIMVAISYQV
jgi:hypothetical protein